MTNTTVETRINFRTDPETKEAATKVLDILGLDMTTALNMFLKQTVRNQALPFTPSVEPTLPQPGTVMRNGITYNGLDEDGYPQISIPDNIGLTPKHDPDGTPILPQSWKD